MGPSRDRTGIELATPGSAVRLISVGRHVTDCATRPGIKSDGLYETTKPEVDQVLKCSAETVFYHAKMILRVSFEHTL